MSKKKKSEEPVNAYEGIEAGESANFSYDAALQTIQSVVETMQNPTIPLDELLAKHQEATQLIQKCRKRLLAIKTVFEPDSDIF